MSVRKVNIYAPSYVSDPIHKSDSLSVFRNILTMSAIARIAVINTGRQVLMRLSQPSVAAVRCLQTSQTSRDIDSGEDSMGLVKNIRVIVFLLQLPSSLVPELLLLVWLALELVSGQCSDL